MSIWNNVDTTSHHLLMDRQASHFTNTSCPAVFQLVNFTTVPSPPRPPSSYPWHQSGPRTTRSPTSKVLTTGRGCKRLVRVFKCDKVIFCKWASILCIEDLIEVVGSVKHSLTFPWPSINAILSCLMSRQCDFFEDEIQWFGRRDMNAFFNRDRVALLAFRCILIHKQRFNQGSIHVNIYHTCLFIMMQGGICDERRLCKILSTCFAASNHSYELFVVLLFVLVCIIVEDILRLITFLVNTFALSSDGFAKEIIANCTSW